MFQYYAAIIINDYILILALSVFGALGSLFLDFCFKEKNIFSGWLDFLADWWLKRHHIKIATLTDLETEIHTEGKHDTFREYKFSKVKWFWFKPLGYCVVCSNVWHSFIILALFGNIFIALPVILLSSFLVRYLNEKL